MVIRSKNQIDRFAIAVMVILLSISCYFPNEMTISKLSTIKYGDSTEIVYKGKPGFFTELDLDNQVDTMYIIDGVNCYDSNILFYPDQSVCYFFPFVDSLKNNDIHKSLKNCIHNINKRKEWSSVWGVFQKKGDYIATEMYMIYFINQWDIYKDLYHIKGDTLVHLTRTMYARDKTFHIIEMQRKYLFIPSDDIPSQSNSFLKRKKWIWRYTNDWNNYMNFNTGVN